MQMNDNQATDLNLTRNTLEGVVYQGRDCLDLKYSLVGVTVETRLHYDSSYVAQQDYEMIIDMLNATGVQMELLNESA